MELKGNKVLEVGIYKITSPSGKIYIGQSVDIKKRFQNYLKYNCKKQLKLLASLKKYGSENHTFEILELCPVEEIHTKEKFYVDKFETFNTLHGLNIRDGGGNKGKISDDQKEKIRNSLKGKKHSPERIEANRLGQLKRYEEKRKSLGIIKKEKVKVKEKRIISQETRDKISKANKGKYFRKNYTHSEETKEKIKNSIKLWWDQKLLK
jgi:group I intron endonuclease